MYTNLFSPVTLNQLEIKNRIAYPSLGVLFSYDRKLNDRYHHFFNEIAKGGAGIVTVGPVGVDYVGSGIAALAIDNDEAIPEFRKLTQSIRENGASPWIQLFHAGGYSHPFLIDNQTPLAPSPIFSNYSKTTPKAMDDRDIDTVQDAFATAAQRAREAGFDGVEIIASAGYLMTQFLSPLKNRRTDGYGGSFENRTRFPRETIERTRKALGSDFPLGIRMAGNDFVEGSNTDLETPKIARVYQEAGVDVINVTGGWHESKVPQLPMELPRKGFAFLAKNIRENVTVPVMASNRITSPAEAETLIREGYADMVNLGRVLIADPFWPSKAAANRADQIRPCVACSQGCTDQIFSGQPVFCIGNPRAGFEGERTVKKSDICKKIMVVGAGVAGLEAAVTAVQAGHRVEVFEKAGDIGGQVPIAAAPPHKQELNEFIRYYRAMLKRSRIPVYLNTEVTPDHLEKNAFDHVILAQGAEPLVPKIHGVDHPKVVTSWEVLKNNPPLGAKVAVIGGGAVGLETALFAAAKGTLSPEMLHFLFTYDAMDAQRLKHHMFNGSSRVTVFEMLDRAGGDVGRSTRWVLLGNLDRYGVKINTGTRVESVADAKVSYRKVDTLEEEDFDTVILALGSRPVQTLEKTLKEKEIPYTAVGDCIQPGKINNAIHGGFLAAINL
ncbi:MAG: FAD-dependent oxidoreductase [Desulfobacteraceae bacterium]|nr:FAD-dependent oxidoreductase [Desulfobacteraceae bacterium]